MEYYKSHDTRFLCAFNADSFHLFIYYKGGDFVSYEFFIGNNESAAPLFTGEDYKPSPLHDIDSIESVVNLLGFLTVPIGGAEKEYFEKYTAAQLDWANSIDCETLGAMVADYEAGEEPYKQLAIEYFENGFTRG
jgi:hypothetical protein